MDFDIIDKLTISEFDKLWHLYITNQLVLTIHAEHYADMFNEESCLTLGFNQTNQCYKYFIKTHSAQSINHGFIWCTQAYYLFYII